MFVAMARTTLILKTRYAHCDEYFIKWCVNLCPLHSLYSGIDLNFVSNILVLASFHFCNIKMLTSSMSKRHQQFSSTAHLSTLISLLFVKIISTKFQEILEES